MSRTLLIAARGLLAAALAIKADIAGDGTEEHEDNTFDLPDGAKIRRRFRGFFREQLRQVLGTVPTIGAELHGRLPRMADWDDPMAAAITPILGSYWDPAGKAIRARIGLDPHAWRVTDPNVHRAIQESSLKLCRRTNATTDLGIAAARDAVRDQLARGLIGRGDTVDQLTNRVKSVFTHATKSRARSIATTEASRAVHAAAIMSAEQTGLVRGKRWLLSAHSCPICVALAAQANALPLDGVFGRVGHDVDYSVVRFPPAHPHCRCTLVFDLVDEPPPERKPERERDRSGEGGGSNPGSSPGLGRLAGRAGRTIVAFAASGPARAGAAAIAATAASTVAGSIAHRRARRLATPDPSRFPEGSIQARVAAYMAGAGREKLERLRRLDDGYVRTIAANAAERSKALRSYENIRGLKGSGSDEAGAAGRVVNEMTDRHREERDRLHAINAARVAEVLAVDRSARAVLATRMRTANRPIPAVTLDAESWLGQVLVADQGKPAGLRVDYGALKPSEDAFYTPKYRRINLSGEEPASIVVHEFGHAIEHQWPGVGKLSEEFLDYRAGGEKLKKLAKLFPDYGFKPWDYARKDHFDEAFESLPAHYVGREYRRKAEDASTRYGTEILSMGLQKLMEDPVTFARKDPEYCAYVMGVLDGSIRGEAIAATAARGKLGSLAGLRYAEDPLSVGAHLKLAEDAAKPHFEAALDAIHKVHGDGGLPDVPAMANNRLKASTGGYVHSPTKPEKIDLDPSSKHQAFTAVHEVGHFLDHQGLGSGGYGFASEDGYPSAKKLMEAINATPQAKGLQKELARSKTKVVRDHLKELIDDKEKFARAYSQYIATRSKNPELLAGLEKDRAGIYGKIAYWSDKEFGPISDHFDAMFREIGWLHDHGDS